MLYRDLKPSNVMLDGHGRTRITDFGLALRAEEVIEWDTSGTPAYMAPEQLDGRGASVRSDLYSLGLVLYELFTGKRAFEAASLAELRKQHAEALPKAPSMHAAEIDPTVERAILRCLEKDPQKRLRHIGDVMTLVDDAPVAPASTLATAPPVHRTRSAGPP